MPPRKRKIKSAAGNPFGKPSWEEFKDEHVIDVDKVAVRKQVSMGSRYYNYKNKSKDGKKWFVEYLKKEKIDKDKIKHVKLVPDWRVGITYGALAKMLTDGCPPLEEYTMALNKRLEELLQMEGKEKVVEVIDPKKVVPVLTIQERMKENLNNFLGKHVEEEIDKFFQNKFKSKFKLLTTLQVNEITGKAAGMIPDLYSQEISDLTELLNPPKEQDDMFVQLTEGYPYKKSELKKILAFYTMLAEDAEHHANAQKATRKIRVKKAPSLDKIVAKLKYKAKDDTYKIVSIDPKKIIGAQELWVFNTKTRKLGKYVAGNGFSTGELSVKGASIVGFDENKSIQKTVRKPDVTLKEFQKAGKVALRKFLEDIKATDIKLTGRINKEIILLKVN
jgi:hypothetical protein